MTQRFADEAAGHWWALDNNLAPVLEIKQLRQICLEYVTSELLIFEGLFLNAMLHRKIYDYHLKIDKIVRDLMYSQDPIINQYMGLLWSMRVNYQSEYPRASFLMAVLHCICRRTSLDYWIGYYVVEGCRRRMCYARGECCCGEPIIYQNIQRDPS